MGFCVAELYAGSVNRYGFCEICGTVHEAAEQLQLRTGEACELVEAAQMAEIADSAGTFEAAGSRREAVG
ncbi:MAG: hypothetical protein M1539_03525 [Actinobacteria bacterium]|nr:hypothetical protein [Actinomycetota bacterium]